MFNFCRGQVRNSREHRARRGRKGGGHARSMGAQYRRSHDVGTMQFNTAYLRDLAPYGITAKDVAASGCYPYDLAAWRLRGHIKNDEGDIWTRAANYHSRAPQHNATYRADLRVKAKKWADWLAARFVTIDVTKNATGSATTAIPRQAARAAPSNKSPVR